jgi:hypothetical protein
MVVHELVSLYQMRDEVHDGGGKIEKGSSPLAENAESRHQIVETAWRADHEIRMTTNILAPMLSF